MKVLERVVARIKEFWYSLRHPDRPARRPGNLAPTLSDTSTDTMPFRCLGASTLYSRLRSSRSSQGKGVEYQISPSESDLMSSCRRDYSISYQDCDRPRGRGEDRGSVLDCSERDDSPLREPTKTHIDRCADEQQCSLGLEIGSIQPSPHSSEASSGEKPAMKQITIGQSRRLFSRSSSPKECECRARDRRHHILCPHFDDHDLANLDRRGYPVQSERHCKQSGAKRLQIADESDSEDDEDLYRTGRQNRRRGRGA